MELIAIIITICIADIIAIAISEGLKEEIQSYIGYYICVPINIILIFWILLSMFTPYTPIKLVTKPIVKEDVVFAYYDKTMYNITERLNVNIDENDEIEITDHSRTVFGIYYLKQLEFKKVKND